MGEALILPKRHPAYRRRKSQSGSCTERENLHGDAKGKGASGSTHEAESTDAPVRGGLLRSSDEASVMLVERREQAIAIWIGSTGNGRRPDSQWKAAAFVRWHQEIIERFTSGIYRKAQGEIPWAYSAHFRPRHWLRRPAHFRFAPKADVRSL